MFVYKISEEVNNYYDLVLSKIDNPEMVAEHWEHYLANNPEDKQSKYLLDKLDQETGREWNK